MGMWTDPMRGVRIFLVMLCLAFLVGGFFHRQPSFRPAVFIPGADSTQTTLFQHLASEVPPQDSIWNTINVNTASANHLEALPGIGPVKAAAVVQYREEHGWFRHADELIHVHGIGPKTLEKIRPLISLDTTKSF